MAGVQNFMGFEFGDATDSQTTSGTFSIQTTVKRTGSYALRVNPTTTNVGYVAYRKYDADGTIATLNAASVTVGIYFRWATLPASGDEEILWGGQTVAQKWSVRIDSAGNLSVYNQADTLIDTGATVLAVDTWYLIEMQAGTSGTAAYELKINTVSELSGTMDTTTTNHAQVRFGKTVNKNGNSVDYFYDDIYIRDDTTYLGASQVTAIVPNANGSTMDWTAGTNSSDFNEVDETPSDSDTTYVKSNAGAGEIALFDMQSAADVGITGTIHGLKGGIYVREDPSATSSNSMRLRSNTTNNDTTARNLPVQYNSLYKVYTTDPATAVAWTTGGVDDVELGSIEANAAAIRMTKVAIEVLYTPAAAGGGGNDWPIMTGNGFRSWRYS